MPTKPDEIRQNDSEPKLTPRQAKFLPILLASPTHTEACRKGRVSRDTLYSWLKDPAFNGELDRHRAELSAQGLALLSQSVVKAVETLAEHSSPQLTNDAYTNVDPVLRQALNQLPVADWV
jgi:hypothetical protein